MVQKIVNQISLQILEDDPKSFNEILNKFKTINQKKGNVQKVVLINLIKEYNERNK